MSILMSVRTGQSKLNNVYTYVSQNWAKHIDLFISINVYTYVSQNWAKYIDLFISVNVYTYVSQN